MKSFCSVFLATVISVSIAGTASVQAKISDGDTPAAEAVCDVLQTATPGLYGLCVAYCEAIDADLLSRTGDTEELNPPNRGILEAYNEMKSESDPAMLCVQPGGCPCWTEAQLETYLLPPATNFDQNLANACALQIIFSGGMRRMIENFEYGSPGFPATGSFFQLTALERPDGTGQCSAFSQDFVGAPPNSVQELNFGETAVCRDTLLEHANDNKIDGILWDCFHE